MTSTDSVPEIKVELKYCEGCGSLCLRGVPPSHGNHHAAASAVEAIYCPSCARLLAPKPSRAASKSDGGRP